MTLLPTCFKDKKMKLYLCFLLLVLPIMSYSQSVSPMLAKAKQQFVELYNQENFEGIFNMFSQEMKEALPLESTNGFLAGLKGQAGMIQTSEFSHEVNGFSCFKTQFENMLFALNLAVDDSGSIIGLMVNPYSPPMERVKAENKLSGASKILTDSELALIYDHSASFPEEVQMAIAVIQNGHLEFYGAKREGDDLVTLDNRNEIFEIGSISKVFTACLLAEHLSEGKITLTDNVNDHFDFGFKDAVPLSFVSLANHTSGLPGLPSNLDIEASEDEPYKNYDGADLEEYLKFHLQLTKENLSQYNYSNLGTGLLGYTCGKIAGTNYETFLKNTITTRYEMPNTTTLHKDYRDKLVKGRDDNGEVVSNWEFQALAGAGGILSNVRDLSSFALAHFDVNNKSLALTRESSHVHNDALELGLGWHILKDKSEHDWFFHNGGTNGYTSSMVIEPEEKNAVIILTNLSAFSSQMGKVDQLSFGLMKQLEKK